VSGRVGPGPAREEGEDLKEKERGSAWAAED